MEIDSGTRELVARALLEDLGSGDVTAEAVVPEDATGRATINQKEPGVVFGLDVVAEVFRQTGAGELEDRAQEGEWRDDVPAVVAMCRRPGTGAARGRADGAQLPLPPLGRRHPHGAFVGRVELTGAKILDTRKTIPGLRALEKAAVAAGGGTNHRMGLYDAILIKENHAALAGGVGEAVRRARARRGPISRWRSSAVTSTRCARAAEAGADRLLLDNMGPVELREAVAVARGSGDGPELEASGGISLVNVREIAETGVDYVSIGALTHSAPALDLSMTLEI